MTQENSSRVAFEEWCTALKDCGHDVHPNSATAKQRYLGWQACEKRMREDILLLTQKAEGAVRYLRQMAKDDVSNIADSIVAEELNEALTRIGKGD